MTAKDGWNEVEQLLKNREDNSPIVAIGEIGLDYYYNHSPRDVQIQVLEAQLQLAVDYDLPVSFHVRDGAPDQPSVWDDFWPIFDNFHGLRGVLHSFTDTRLNGFLVFRGGVRSCLQLVLRRLLRHKTGSAALQILARCPTLLRFAPCIACFLT